MKKIYVKVNTIDNIISVKYGRFGDWTQYGGGWYNACSLQEVIDHFAQTELKNKVAPATIKAKLAEAR